MPKYLGRLFSKPVKGDTIPCMDDDTRDNVDAAGPEEPTRYCHKLGHSLGFGYCKREKEGMPCRNIERCWADREFLKRFLEKFKAEEIRYIYEPPVSKITSLADIVKRVKERLKDSEN